MVIYHNPHCMKSRAGLKYLEEKGYTLEIKKYITEGITESELREVIAKTGKKPSELIRTQEKLYREKYRNQNLTDDEWIKVLAENPKLLQRPIVVNGNEAVVADPPEEVELIM